MRHSERCAIWKQPENRGEWLNSMGDAFAAMPPGKTLVYRISPVTQSAQPLPEMLVASETAGRLGGTLVQWPNAPVANDKRTWCWGIKKRAAIAKATGDA